MKSLLLPWLSDPTQPLVIDLLAGPDLILLERWTIEFTPHHHQQHHQHPTPLTVSKRDESAYYKELLLAHRLLLSLLTTRPNASLQKRMSHDVVALRYRLDSSIKTDTDASRPKWRLGDRVESFILQPIDCPVGRVNCRVEYCQAIESIDLMRGREGGGEASCLDAPRFDASFSLAPPLYSSGSPHPSSLYSTSGEMGGGRWLSSMPLQPRRPDDVTPPPPPSLSTPPPPPSQPPFLSKSPSHAVASLLPRLLSPLSSSKPPCSTATSLPIAIVGGNEQGGGGGTRRVQSLPISIATTTSSSEARQEEDETAHEKKEEEAIHQVAPLYDPFGLVLLPPASASSTHDLSSVRGMEQSDSMHLPFALDLSERREKEVKVVSPSDLLQMLNAAPSLETLTKKGEGPS